MFRLPGIEDGENSPQYREVSATANSKLYSYNLQFF